VSRRMVDERGHRTTGGAERGLSTRRVLEWVGEPGPRDGLEPRAIAGVTDKPGEEAEKLPAIVWLGTDFRRDIGDHRTQIGVAAEAAGEPNVGTLRCREKRRAPTEAEAGDRHGSRDPSGVVQRDDDGGDLAPVQLERRERVELRHEGQRSVAREESGEADQVGLSAAG